MCYHEHKSIAINKSPTIIKEERNFQGRDGLVFGDERTQYFTAQPVLLTVQTWRIFLYGQVLQNKQKLS